MHDPLSLWSILIQGGFAAFALIILCMNYTVMMKLFTVIRDNTRATDKLSNVVMELGSRTDETNVTLTKVYEHLLQRPCLMGNGTVSPPSRSKGTHA